MDDRVDAAAGERRRHRVGVGQITDHQAVGRHRLAMSEDQVVEHRDVVAAFKEVPHRVAADVAGPARHQDPHGLRHSASFSIFTTAS